jgi:hypothetical protein
VIKGQGLRMIKDKAVYSSMDVSELVRLHFDYQEAKELDRAKEIEEYIENIGRGKRQEFQEAKEVVSLLEIENE